MTTAVVTGGAGFIGSHLTEHLLQIGHTVRVIDDLATGSRDNLASFAADPRFSLFVQSVTDLARLQHAFAGAELVFHHAALPSVPLSIKDPLRVHEVCVTGTLNVLLAARAVGVRRVVYVSSSAVYGDNQQAVQREDAPLLPISPYGAAKLAGEQYCHAFTASYGLETVCLRYFNVFGPRQDPTSDYAAVIPIFIRKMLAGEAATIYGDGEQTRDFVHVGNVVRANVLAAAAPEAVGGVFNIGVGEPISLNQLAAALNSVLGCDLAPTYAPVRQGDIRHSCADISRARDILDYTPTISLADGLAQTAAWLRAAHSAAHE